ncbi:MAG: leucine-rich repeat domain-containing protein [Peptococcaceae bacterium]|nr:leucine-rich repeat domain-containing protein [Peptococcaceae bacterium]
MFGDNMKNKMLLRVLRIAICVMFLTVFIGFCTGCQNSGEHIPDPVVEEAPEINVSLPSEDDCFAWEGNEIRALTEKGQGEKYIVVPQRATKIRDEAFSKNTVLRTIGFQNQDIELGNNVFKECSFLAKVQLPSNLDRVPDGTFQWCTSLEDADIPASVTEIGNEAFYQCVLLKKVSHGPALEKIGNHAFQICNTLTSFDFTPEINSIGYYAFAYCRSLESVTLQSTELQEIEKATFAYCDILRSVVIPEGVEKIGAEAFSDCPKLEEIQLPKSLAEIDKTAFGTLKLANPVVKKFKIIKDSYADIHFSEFAKQDDQVVHY